jgi:hypothetical protein
MFCTNCGANVPANSNFCGHCGAKIAAPVVAQFADTSNIEVPARPKPEPEASARPKPETARSAGTSNIEVPARPKPTEAPVRPKPETARSGGRRSLIVFIVVGLLVALPASWLVGDLGPGVSGGAAFLVTFAIAIFATWIYEKFVYRPPSK